MDVMEQVKPKRPYKPRTGISRLIWLHILAEGGRWSAGEIAEALPQVDASGAHSLLFHMAAGKQLRKFEKAGRGLPVRYGITDTCVPPQGVTIEDLARAGFKIVQPDPH